jgi:hypothetical protein
MGALAHRWWLASCGQKPASSGPASKYYRYFGPDAETEGEGGIVAWPDSGTAPLIDLGETNPVRQPFEQVGEPPQLTALTTVRTTVNHGVFTEGFALASGSALSVAGVAQQQDVLSFQCPWQVYDDNGNPIGMGLYYAGPDNNLGDDGDLPEGWYLWQYDSGAVVTDYFQITESSSDVIAYAIRINADGTWHAIVSTDWGESGDVEGSFSFPLGAASALQVGYDGELPDDLGKLLNAELRLWTRALSDAELAAQVDDLRNTWQPFETLRWYGPTLTPGAVSEWLDTSSAHVPVENPYAPAQPTAAVGLNGLVTLHGSASHPLYSYELNIPGGKPTQFEFVIVAAPGCINSVAYAFSDAETTYGWVFFDGDDLYFSAEGPESENSLVVLLGSGPGTYSGACAWNASTGEWRTSVSKDWGAPEVQTDTTPDVVSDEPLTGIGINGSVLDVTVVDMQFCEWRISQGASLPSEAQQAAVLAELESVWRPPPVLLEVTTTPQVFTSGNWPAADMNGAVDFTIAFTSDVASSGWSGLGPSDRALFSSEGNGGFWFGASGGGVGFGIYDLGGGQLCTNYLEFASGVTPTITVRRSNNTVEFSGFIVGDGSVALAPGVWFDETADLTVGNYSAGGYLFPGTIGNVLQATP